MRIPWHKGSKSKGQDSELERAMNRTTTNESFGYELERAMNRTTTNESFGYGTTAHVYYFNESYYSK